MYDYYMYVKEIKKYCFIYLGSTLLASVKWSIYKMFPRFPGQSKSQISNVLKLFFIYLPGISII